jgi:hypothetical protein
MRFSLKTLVPFLALAAGVSSSQLTFAALTTSTNLYVSTTGNDHSVNGSTTKPWATIAHASSQAGAGAVIHVAAGVYKGSFNTTASGTASAYVTYVADTANFSAPVNCAQVAANHSNLATCVQLVGSSGTT